MLIKYSFVVLFAFLQLGQAEKLKVLVTSSEIPKAGLDLLTPTLEVITSSSSKEDIIEKGKGVHAILWSSLNKLDTEILDSIGSQLKVVATYSAGTNNIDIPELKKRNILLGNTPKVLSGAVADLAVGLMLAAARRFHEVRQKVDSSNWGTLNEFLGQDIKNSTIGFLGFGGIGQEIAKRLTGFDVAKMLYTTRHRIDPEIEKKFNAKKVDFSTMLSNSDIIFTAVPLTSETTGIFNSTSFGKMKKNAVFINISRGKIVNQKDLYDALKSNQIFAAGLDVTDPEPLPADDPLLSLPNLVITPHIGSATNRVRSNMAILAANNILKGLAGEPLPAPVY